MRALALVALVSLVAFAGCIQGGQPLSATEESEVGDANTSDPHANATANEEPTANGTNTSEPGEAGDDGSQTDRDGNATDDASEPERVELPGNLSMAGAEVLERSAQQVRFRWEASVSPEEGQNGLERRTTFDVPEGVPLVVNASLTWSQASDLDLFVDGENVDYYCSSATPVDPGLEGGRETCSARTFARSAWDTWGVRIDGRNFGRDAAPRPANFSVELAIGVAEPWTGPPFGAPDEPADVPSDPGWPALGDAEIRPSVKVGSAGSGVNAGTGNFVFSSPDNRSLYLGWVAHGVDGLEPGDTIELPTVGVEATLVYCSWGIIEETVTCPRLTFAPEHLSDATTHPRFFNDFALLQLPASSRSLVHPAVPVWGGPEGIAAQPTRGEGLRALGNTPFRDAGRGGVNGLDPMQGATWTSTDRRIETHLFPQPVPGDSGSPVLTETGEALGTIAAISGPGVRGPVTEPRPETGAATTIVPALANAVAVMEDETALDVELKTWPPFDQPHAEDLAEPPADPDA